MEESLSHTHSSGTAHKYSISRRKCDVIKDRLRIGKLTGWSPGQADHVENWLIPVPGLTIGASLVSQYPCEMWECRKQPLKHRPTTHSLHRHIKELILLLSHGLLERGIYSFCPSSLTFSHSNFFFLFDSSDLSFWSSIYLHIVLPWDVSESFLMWFNFLSIVSLIVPVNDRIS